MNATNVAIAWWWLSGKRKISRQHTFESQRKAVEIVCIFFGSYTNTHTHTHIVCPQINSYIHFTNHLETKQRSFLQQTPEMHVTKSIFSNLPIARSLGLSLSPFFTPFISRHFPTRKVFFQSSCKKSCKATVSSFSVFFFF